MADSKPILSVERTGTVKVHDIMEMEMDFEGEQNGVTLVLGGSGKTGRRVTDKLRALGVNTRAVSRSTTPRFNWNDPTSWTGVLNGVTAVYITYAPDLAIPGAREQVQAFSQLAAEHNVQRLVLLSGRGEKEAQRCEHAVQELDIEWTIVRASWFMQNLSEGEFLGMVRGGAITLPAADVGEPFIDVNDIADVVVAALTEPGHAHEIYEVTGPRLLSFEQVASEISKATTRSIGFVQVPSDVFASEIAHAGVPEDVAWLLGYLFDTVLDGRNSRICDGVFRALGRQPVDFVTFAGRVAARGDWAEAEQGAAA